MNAARYNTPAQDGHAGAHEETPRPLGAGPLQPESDAASKLFEDDKYSYLRDEALAERREWERQDRDRL